MTTPLAAESLRLATLTRDSLADLTHAETAIRATLTPAQTALFERYDAAMSAHLGHAGELHVAELARHLPGFAPALLALSAHIWETAPAGQCCTPA